MPIPVGRSGNVDGEGGTAHSILCPGTMAGEWWHCASCRRHLLRVWLEPHGVQRKRAIRRARSARLVELARTSPRLFASVMASVLSVAELTNDADDHSTDGS